MLRPKCWTSGLPLVMLAFILAIGIAGPAPGFAGTTIATDVISSGGQQATSASFNLHDTIGQGPIGPVATGTTVEVHDGFWATMTARGAPADTIPPTFVYPFDAVAGDTTITLSWTNPTDTDFAGTLVIYKTSGYPTGPTDGTPVPNGQGGRFYNSPGSSDGFVHTGLANGMAYNYCAYAFDGATNYAIGADATATPADIIPPTAVSSFTATAGDTTVVLRWTNSADPDFGHALVRFSTVSAPTTPTGGSPVPNGNSGVFLNAPASVDSFVHTDLTNGVTYYYSIWCGDEVPNYSGYWDASATPEDIIPPGQPDYFTAAAKGERAIILRWKNPSDADLEEIQIRYSTSAYPSLPTGGVAVENGNGGSFAAVPAAVDSFVHSGLTVGATYYYSAFTFDEVMNYPSPKSDSAIPVDNSAPGVEISVFQNPYVTNHLDVYLIASEEVEDASVSVEVNGNPITMQESDALKYVYRGDYDLCCTGSLTIEGCATDLAGNDSCSTRSFSSSLIFAASGGTAHSADGRFEVGFPGRAVANDAYVLVLQSDFQGYAVYETSPGGMALSQYVEIAIAYDAADGDPEHLCIAGLDGDVAAPIDSYLDREGGRILAYVEKLGSYRLLRREEAVTPTYGSGRFKILSNAPNPFVASTSIEFEVIRAGRIEVEIVSVDGRHVRAISEDFVPPGRRSLVWDGCDDYGRRVAAGMYICRAVSGRDEVTHKMVYLR